MASTPSRKPPPKRSKLLRDFDPAAQLRRAAKGELPEADGAQADVMDRLWKIIDAWKVSHADALLGYTPERHRGETLNRVLLGSVLAS
jgi:hypothetical protein